ncbi:disease resistance protein tao1, partial [Quercus suber]
SEEEYRPEIILNVVVEGLLAKLRSNVIEHHIKNIKTINESLNILKDDIASYDLRVEFVNSIPEISFNREIDSFLDDSKVNQNVGNNIVEATYCDSLTETTETPPQYELTEYDFPTLGHLPSLRVRSIGSEFCSYSEGSYRNTTALFPALRILKLLFMSSLEEWKDAMELSSAGEVLVFPCLEELIIRGCNKLRDLPDSLHTCISLQKLVVQDCPKLRSLPGVLSITTLPSGVQCYTSSIEYMENGDCLPSTSSIQPSLQKLKLYGSVLFLDQIQYFIALKILWIQEFGEMVALPEWLGNLSSLQVLYIVDCKNLVHLPTEETMRRLTELKTVMIYGCHKLNNQIDHNPFIQFPNS